MSLSNMVHPQTNITIKWLIWLEWASLLTGLGLITITEVYSFYVLIGLFLLGIAFTSRTIRCHHLVTITNLELPWILFIGSAAIGASIAYDPKLAFLQFARILATLILFYAICDSTVLVQGMIVIGFVIAASLLAIYWPLHHDFTFEPAKFQSINNLGLWMNAHLPKPDLTILTGLTIHPNVAAGTLLLALPFATVLFWNNWHENKMVCTILSGAAIMLILGGLIMTTSRGAWLALFGTTSLAILSWIQRHWFFEKRSKVRVWGITALLAIGLVIVLQVTGNLTQLLGQIPDINGSLQSRPLVWRQGLNLVRDYFFTGSGLMTTSMVYATYARLIDTPFILHIHNAFLEVWLEQGFLGVIALVWTGILIIGWAWKALTQKQVSSWGWAGLVACIAASLHGVFDVVFYIERTLPLIGLVMGFAWLIKTPSMKQKSISFTSPLGKWLVIGITTFFLLGGIVFHRTMISAWHANSGAITQTYLELRKYNPQHFDNPTLDQVRRSLDLRSAETEYQKSLEWNSQNLTARQRISEIALSRGEYNTALDLMRSAWNNAHTDDVTLLLYGDALVANGQPEQAAVIVGSLSSAISRLMGQAWYRYWLEKDYQRAAYAWETVLYLDPNNQNVEYWLGQAKAKLQP